MLLTISGPSTVGKDSTWTRIAAEFGFSREVPFTTRPRRANETEGQHYHFVALDDFRQLIQRNEVTAWDFILGNYYGTGLSLGKRVRAGENVVLQVLGRMAIRLKSRLPDVRTVMLQVSERTMLRTRLQQRGYAGEEIQQRLDLANEELIHSPMFDYVVPDADILTNDQVKRVILEVTTEIDGAR